MTEKEKNQDVKDLEEKYEAVATAPQVEHEEKKRRFAFLKRRTETEPSEAHMISLSNDALKRKLGEAIKTGKIGKALLTQVYGALNQPIVQPPPVIPHPIAQTPNPPVAPQLDPFDAMIDAVVQQKTKEYAEKLKSNMKSKLAEFIVHLADSTP